MVGNSHIPLIATIKSILKYVINLIFNEKKHYCVVKSTENTHVSCIFYATLKFIKQKVIIQMNVIKNK